MKRSSIVALAGGIGAAKFLQGLARAVPSRDVFIIGNTGDDTEMYGLHVSPDLDSVMYALAGMNDPRRGWGLRRETFRCLERLGGFGAPTWFQLGDQDLATHLCRTEWLREGRTLAEVTARLAAALGVRSAIVPMSNARIRTRIVTPAGELEFQDYFVRRRARDKVLAVRFAGAAGARPAPGVISAIRQARIVILCPSNPFISIAPILAVPGIRAALRQRRERVIAISPIVGGRAVKGPAARMMKSIRGRSTAGEVARMYRDFAATFVMDEVDRASASEVEALGMRAVVTDTLMSGLPQKGRLARTVLRTMGKE